MFVLGELFKALAFLTTGVCQIIYWLLFAKIIISWFPIDPSHPVVSFLTQVTEPILAPFRRIPLRVGILDLTPLLAFTALYFINQVLLRVFLTLAVQFGAS